MKVLFLPCYLDGLSMHSPSVRWRAQWPAKYWEEADVFDGQQRLRDYDVFIFQKFYLVDQARLWARSLRAKNKLLVFDLCDPDFLSTEHKQRLLQILPLFDLAVATTEPIRNWLARWLPAYVIPDRIDLEAHPEKKQWDHSPERVRLVWYGFAHNALAIQSLWPTIKDLDLPLTVISDEPLKGMWLYEMLEQHDKFSWRQWKPDTVHRQIVEHDIALNPQPAEIDERLHYKSHNKDLTAWALGMPMAKTPEELIRLLDFDERRAEAEERLIEVRERWDVRLSVREWEKLLNENRADRRG